MKNFSVFYAWQSDTPGKVNRYFIGKALEDALNRIAKDANVAESPEFDHDTKGVSGIPEIASTILSKIDECGIFVSDVTIVGKVESADGEIKKLLPNPNVMLELGYALKSLGSESIICVMNTAFGPVEAQVFDIAHRRWPITYELESYDDPKRAEKQKLLSKRLEGSLRMIIDQGILERRDPSVIRDGMIRDQFKHALLSFLALFRFVIFHEHEVQPFSPDIVKIFGLDSSLIDGGGVDTSRLNEELAGKILNGRDWSRQTKITTGDTTTLTVAQANILLAKKLENACQEIIRTYAASGDPKLIGEIQRMAIAAGNYKWFEGRKMHEFPDQFVKTWGEIIQTTGESLKFLDTTS